MSFSTVTLLGNLVRDPELKYTPKGSAVVQLNVAINRKWKSESGEMKEEVSFIGCVAFGKTAESIAKFFRKGSPIILQGRLKQETWEDKATAAKKSKTVVVVEFFDFAGGKRVEGEAQPSASAQPSEFTPPKFTPPPSKSTEPIDDDVPF